MSQIYLLSPTILEKRPINNRHKHIKYPKANNSNVKFGINKPEKVDDLIKRYSTHFKNDFRYKLIIRDELDKLLSFENYLKEIFFEYINKFREETNYSRTKEWMSGIKFEDAEKIIVEEYKKFST